MNKHLYRIIFNKARGIMMAVAENVSAQAKGEATSSASGVIKPMMEQICLRLKSISFAAKLTAGVMTCIMPIAHAQIIADPTAPNNQRPTIVQTANGLPQVNIQAPSAAGVSRNTYSQFDVQSNGAILNNSRDNVLTQTGGWVQANPWLSGGAARVILNEVNSSNPSHLRGYVEVAGQKAEVIIANPAGIQINGGGFINADRVTLTTGTAVSNPVNGSLESYRISQGMISVDGLGLDTRGATYTDILARSAQVNAGIWANRLNVVTGANEVTHGSLDNPANVRQDIKPIAGTGLVPQFSLDVAALGGMYAGHIYLVGNEAGMGVRNQGNINANGGNLVLLANGVLTNEGAIQAASSNGSGGKLHIETAAAITNTGAKAVISAQEEARLKTNAELINSAGARIDANKTVVIHADALKNAGKLNAVTDLRVYVRNLNNTASGEIVADKNTLQAASRLSNRGLIDGSAMLLQTETLDNIGTGRIYGDQLAIVANTLNNDSEEIATRRSDAVIAARERLDIGVETLNNRDGSLLFSAGTHASALNIGRSLDAQAHATGKATVVTNKAATIESAGGLTIIAGKINNLNPDFSTRTETTNESVSGHYIRLGGTRYLESELGRCFKCASDKFDDGDPGRYRLEYVRPSSIYPFEKGYSRVPYQLITYKTEYDPTNGNVTTQVPYDYPSDSPVWKLFGVTVDDQVSLTAQQDIHNQGGRVLAQDRLNANAGRDLILESTTSTGMATSGRSSSSLTQIDRVAGLYVTGEKGILVASAGNDFSVLAGVLSSKGDIQASAANNVNLGTVQTAYNSDLTANERNYIRASGTTEIGSHIAATGNVEITAGNNVEAKAATVQAKENLRVSATGDIQIAEGRATSQSDEARYAKNKSFASSHSTESRVQTDSNTSISSNFSGKDVSLTSGGDAVIRGANVIASGDATVRAGKDLTIESATNASQSSSFYASKNGSVVSRKSNKGITDTFDTQAVSSAIAGKNVTLTAGNDAALLGSHINAVQDAKLTAGQDIKIAAVTEQHNIAQVSETKKSGLSGSFQTGLSVGSSKSKQTLDQQSKTAITSSVSGSNVQINAKRDADILGSAVLADKDINIAAGRNINIDVVNQTQSTTSTSKSSNSSIGLAPSLSGSMTILGITADKQNGQADGQSAVTSLLSANAGNLSMVAGNAGTQDAAITTRGADLLAGKAITLEADRIDLLAAHDTSSSSHQAESKSFTVGSKPTGQIGGLINSAIESAMAASKGSGNNRLDNALALKAGYDSYKAIEKSVALANSAKDAAAGLANADPGGSAFGVSITVGSSKSSSSSTTADTQVTGTNLQAKSIDLTARQTDITMEGAKLQAATINLEAKRDVTLLAAANTSALESSNKSSSASVGATFGVGQQSGISFQAGMQKSKGNAKGEETTYDNTLITATDKLTIKSGKDTSLKGAQLAAKQIQMDVGGNLTIATLQDRSQYQSEQKSSGFGVSVCVPPLCMGSSSVSVNASKQSIKHNYQSTQGQSGISVGDGGFDIKVGGTTELIAAAITSTADQANNTLSTASLSSSDLSNAQSIATTSKSFSGTAIVGAGATVKENISKLGNDTSLNLMGNAAANKALPKNSSEQSQTLSVISPANITITGENAEQNAQSQQTAEELTSRDASTANGALTNTLTLQQAAELEKKMQQAHLEEQAARLMGELGQKMAKDVGTYAANKVTALTKEANEARNAGNERQ